MALFDGQIALLTLKNVLMLLLFVATGWVLRHYKRLPENASSMVSVLATLVFVPAYTLNYVTKTFTLEMLGSNLRLLGVSCLWCGTVIVVGRILGKLLGRNDFEKKSLYYMLSFTNNGFFGYPVIQGVFGDEMLARFIIFSIPIGFVGNFYGYGLFSDKGSFNVKKSMFSLVNLSSVLGCVFGLLGITFPDFLGNALQTAGSCMSPAAMILAGLVLGAFGLKELVSSLRPYFIGLLRLLIIPALLVPLFWLIGLRGENFFFCAVTTCLPVGLNCVVYPEACGFDASDNAKVAFVSFVMSLVTLPVTFSLILSMIKIFGI